MAERAGENTIAIDVPEARIYPATCPPPRHVPIEAYLGMLFGGSICQIGWLLFGFGLIFFWVFTWNSELVGGLAFFGEKSTATGTVQRVESTSASENDAPVDMLVYRFVASDGSAVQGKAYVTGGTWRGGETVTVEYLRRDPSVSRIPGTRRSLFGTGGVFAAIFPFIGLALLLFGLNKGLRSSKLLSRGHLAYGELVRNSPTNVTVNNRPVMAMTFEFHSQDGMTHQVVSKTSQTDALEDESLEMLLYDASNPKAAMFIDDLPGLPDVTSDKGIVLRSPRGIGMVLILPLITLIGHGMYFLYLISR